MKDRYQCPHEHSKWKRTHGNSDSRNNETALAECSLSQQTNQTRLQRGWLMHAATIPPSWILHCGGITDGRFVIRPAIVPARSQTGRVVVETKVTRCQDQAERMVSYVLICVWIWWWALLEEETRNCWQVFLCAQSRHGYQLRGETGKTWLSLSLRVAFV